MRKKSLIVSIFIIVSLMTFGCWQASRIFPDRRVLYKNFQILHHQVIQVAGIQRAIQKTTHQMTIKTIQKIVNHKKIIQQIIINQKKQQIQQL